MSSQMMKQFGKVAVLMGGVSGEREISLRSGNAVLAALERLGVEVHSIDPRQDIFTRLLAFDRAFIALHGHHGEDGTVQGGLEMIGIPYTGSGVLASSLCMDKRMTKMVWQASSIDTPAFMVLQEAADCDRAIELLGFPMVVKPALEGSSLGINKVTSAQELQSAYQEAKKFHGAVIAEKFIGGAEYTVAILGGVALPVIKLETPRTFYDFTAKYESNDTRYICPCGLSEAREKSLQQAALDAFHAVGATGWGRVDVMLDEEQTAWFLEVNTVPGMTDHSLVPMAAKAQGIGFDELVLRILKTSLDSE